MQVETLSFRGEEGWSQPFPAMDSCQTLVVVFGDSRFMDAPQAIDELAAAYPEAVIMGCSTSR
ncbi:MAG: FIST N-terminal domain-containing protein, partial [Gammaproteobacteria bacterium]